MIRTLALCILSSLLIGQDPAEGTWHGDIDLKSFGGLKFQVTLTNDGDAWKGTINIPEQNAFDLKLDQVSADGDTVHFELLAGPGRAKWEGKLADGVIKGTFRQGIVKGSFEMKPGKLPSVRFTPELTPTYRAAEVKIKAGEHALAGTLTIPAGDGPFPAVVLVTGSGPQTRDEVVSGFAVFGHIADHLSRNGVCVLRYDDRGTGDSTGEFSDATTMDFADDAEAALAWLRKREEIDSKRTGIIGHSEGGIIASIVAARDNATGFIVLLAGPAVNGMEILGEQSRLISEADGSPAEAIADNTAILKAIFAAVKGEGTWEDAEVLIRKAIKRGASRGDPRAKAAAEDMEKAIAAQTARFKDPWMRSFLLFEPRLVLAKVTCPVLALFGEKDLQVPPAQSAPVMRKLFEKSGNKRAAIKTIADANHLFQKADTGSPSEYGRLEKAFASGFLDTILDFIK